METGTLEKKPVRISVGGQAFTVLAPGDPSEILQLAAQVDEIMTRVASLSGLPDSMRAAILTCLHLADRARTLEREMDDLRKRIDEKTRRIAGILDGALASPAPPAVEQENSGEDTP
ncbi:MAG: cell division protein ZapA [Acidobacteria bacterium]|nr:cell division protein ZapA [Acidobacteriota bacterium]